MTDLVVLRFNIPKIPFQRTPPASGKLFRTITPQMSQINTDELNAVTEKIIGCVFAVYNVLGSGFLEKAYDRASLAEIKRFANFR